MIIKLSPNNEAIILACNTIVSFLDSGESGNSYWRDKEGNGFVCDMGYLREGLYEIKQYCEQRIKEGQTKC